MKIVVACDSYKGCLTSKECADLIERGINKVDTSIKVSKHLIGDGGEGTLEAFVSCTNGKYIQVQVYDAYHKKIDVEYGMIDDTTAIIEISKIIGLNMYPRSKRNVMYASSYGVGQVLKDALKRGCKRIILALGGSCSNDGGMGMLNALGMRFYDHDHNLLIGIPTNLHKIAYIDKTHLIDFSNVECIAACDVKNYLLGKNGATYVYGKQKGVYADKMALLDEHMTHYANKMKEIGYDLTSVVGGGAAGGIGASFISVLNASMKAGIDLLISYNNIEKDIKDCDLVITGEGCSDKQSMYGKVCAGILNVSKKYNKPCICISGALGVEYMMLYELGFTGIYSIADGVMDYKSAIKDASIRLENASYTIVKTIHRFMEEKQ